MRRLSFYMFLLAAAAIILFLSWSLFSGNADAGEASPPNAGGPAGEAAGTSQAEQEKLKNLAAYQGGEREILDAMAAVSYTHLDVYKRQGAELVFIRAHQLRRILRMCYFHLHARQSQRFCLPGHDGVGVVITVGIDD